MFSIKEYFLDLTTNTQLFELAFKRKEILNKCSDLSYQICSHIVKLTCFDNPNDIQGHLKSLNSWIRRIYELKHKNNISIQWNYYYDEIWHKRVDSPDDLKTIFNELHFYDYENVKVRQVNYIALYDKLSELMQDMCQDIEKRTLRKFEFYLDKFNVEYK